jgi:ABC transport system ATP-binding/permease protein
MPPILNAQGLTKAFGAAPLFRDVAFPISEGDRIGLIGPNGSGKSTLMRVLSGTETPDSGDIAIRKRATVGYVQQTSDFAPGRTVRSVVKDALIAAKIPEVEHDARIFDTLGRAGFVETASQWGIATFDAEAATLSGGWRKRLAIAETLVARPDVLLLDEPTNHLDLEGIQWLEGLLRQGSFACVVVSHDRYFLENVATEMVELNRVYAGGALRVKGNYSKFLEGKELYLEAQSKQQSSLKNRVTREIEWLRRGPKARATKSKARIDSAHEMIGELRQVNERVASVTAKANIGFAATERETKRLIEGKRIISIMGERTLFGPMDVSITAGMRLGLVGPNGSGKTTLMRMLAGQLEPNAGTIKPAQGLRVVYFDQNRFIDESLTLRRALAPDSDAVVYQDRVIHVASWAARFLFTGEQLNQPVERLSGGERARVLIAKLMLQPADVLLLDEPTNDLDIPTLEILEESLLEFKGALILVTHDRYLLDRVSTTVLGLDGRGGTERFADYSQWEQWQQEGGADRQQEAPKAAKAAGNTSGSSAPASGKKKLSYLEAREFATIEQRVEEAEEKLRAAHEAVEDPTVATNAEALQKALATQEQAQEEMDKLYARWAELTEKAG